MPGHSVDRRGVEEIRVIVEGGRQFVFVDRQFDGKVELLRGAFDVKPTHPWGKRRGRFVVQGEQNLEYWMTAQVALQMKVLDESFERHVRMRDRLLRHSLDTD